jgi:hypothetical protein
VSGDRCTGGWVVPRAGLDVLEERKNVVPLYIPYYLSVKTSTLHSALQRTELLFFQRSSALLAHRQKHVEYKPEITLVYWIHLGQQ